MNRQLLTACLFLAAAIIAHAAPSLPPGVENTQKPGDLPLAPAESLKRITVPEGFNVTQFAAEPDVHQPIAFTFDDRGRMWVVECYSYPKREFDGKDRILIFEDTDNDGRFDKRTVFWDEGSWVFGIEVGFGGVWLTAAPNLLFIPDANGDDKPDGKPQILLDGFSTKAKHNSVNGLKWGPDGWLYGRHGITDTSHVGKPGTPGDQRIEQNCSIWRYHPIRKIHEVIAHGTTNPWGHDWDEHGQLFFSNNVIGHLWHVVPGARYARMFGEHFNPHTYEVMQACSDHLHWTGEKWQDSRAGDEHLTLGGGHSHCGGMIYAGDNWPDEYRGQFFMSNTHGRRVIHDRLERKGSGYVAKHVRAPFMMANDQWFRGVTVEYGPDGGVFVSDWNDLGECHDHDGTFRASGRIYKIVHGKPNNPGQFDLRKKKDSELIQLLSHKNEWFRRHAQRILHERAASGSIGPDTLKSIRALQQKEASPPQALRYLWAGYTIADATGKQTTKQLLDLTTHENEYTRWWAVQLLMNRGAVSPEVVARFTQLARVDESALVRLAVASTLHRLPIADRWDIASALLAKDEDAEDHNLPLIVWYGIEPAVAADRGKAVRLLGKCKSQKIRQFITRRMTAP